MNKILEILIGAILVVVPILLVLFVPIFANWGVATLELIKGGVVIVVILIGIFLIVLGATE